MEYKVVPIKDCKDKTDHAEVPGTGFCACTHVMFSEGRMSETPSCTVHAAPMTLKQGERGKTFWTCQFCDLESTERLRSRCESSKPEDHAKFKELYEKREAERYWFYDYLCDGCKQRVAKAITMRRM